MKSRISPLVQGLLREAEDVELVVCGGYGAVREFFILTDQRIVIARQLARRLAAVSFDRERELWMELRANRLGTDFLLCSSDTMERIRNVSDCDLTLLKTTFELEEGDFEDSVPNPDKMYELFKGLPGSTVSSGEVTPVHYAFFAVATILFAILAFEGGRLLGPLRHGGGQLAWWLIAMAGLSAALLVKSSLQMASFITIGLPALMAGIERAAPGVTWELTVNEALLLAIGALLIWFCAALLQSSCRRIGGAPLLPPSPVSLGITCLLIAVLIFASMYQRRLLSPSRQRIFVRRLYYQTEQCRAEIWAGATDRVVLFDNRLIVAASLKGGPEGSWEIWTHTEHPPTQFPITSRFADGMLYHCTGRDLAAFDTTRGMDEWTYTFPRPTGNQYSQRLNIEARLPTDQDEIDVLAWWVDTEHRMSRRRPASTELVILDRLTGEVQWLRRLPLSWRGLPPGRPSFVKSPINRLLVDIPGYQLHCLNRIDGSDAWVHQWEPGAHGPVCAGSTVAFLQGRTLRTIALQDGSPLWHAQLPGTPLWPAFRHATGSIVVAIAGREDKRLLFFDPERGELEAERLIPKGVTGNLDFTNAANGLISCPAGIWRFHRGERADWFFPSQGTTCVNGPFLHDGRVYFATAGGFVMAIDDRSGSLLWRYRARGPIVKGGLLIGPRGPLAMTRTGVLHAFNR